MRVRQRLCVWEDRGGGQKQEPTLSKWPVRQILEHAVRVMLFFFCRFFAYFCHARDKQRQPEPRGSESLLPSGATTHCTNTHTRTACPPEAPWGLLRSSPLPEWDTLSICCMTDLVLVLLQLWSSTLCLICTLQQHILCSPWGVVLHSNGFKWIFLHTEHFHTMIFTRYPKAQGTLFFPKTWLCHFCEV